VRRTEPEASPNDGKVGLRPIIRLALPALVVLAAEPIYLLVDTAIVGHLGSTQLAALALGGGVLALAVWLGTVLAYGTTGTAARRFGAGSREAAVAEGVQASWIALGAGVALALAAQLGAAPLTRLLAGGDTEVARAAALWLRIAALGAPGIMLAMAGNGWMRGVQDTRRPVVYVLASNVVSAVICPILVYPVELGLAGSAVANAVAQSLGGVLFARSLLRERVPLAPHPATLLKQLVIGRDLLVRGAALQACFLSASAVAARFGEASLAAHQIALQLWFFTALALDAVAIAGQSLVGASLGSGDIATARRLAWRIARIGAISGLVFAIAVAAGAVVLPGLFSPDPLVREQALVAWPWFVATQPLAGVVFALDGVLIGAGDVQFMRNLTVAAGILFFLPAIWLAYALDLGLGGVWAGLACFIVARLVGMLTRVRGARWAVAGAIRY
jgi:putative MATE family efflux protein